MNKSDKNADVINLVVSSEFQALENIIQKVKSFLNTLDIEDDFRLVVVVRELIMNAIEHGNQKNPALKVRASVEKIGDLRFKVIVRDEGTGFDYRGIDLTMPEDPKKIRKRGLALVNSYADQLEFNENGNTVTAYLTLPGKTDFKIDSDNDWTTVKPSGDLTAASAEQFRSVLLELLNARNRNFEFDFENVQDIDSISLSIFIVFAKMVEKEESQAQLRIINASSDIVNMFQLTRLDRTYQVSN